jgi:AcrR family transcriptional regulator
MRSSKAHNLAPAAPLAPTAKPRKTRAVGLSRERVVAESLRYLRENPTEPLTLARAAASVGATSMALYRHFRDGADLSDAIVTEVLAGLGDEIPTNAEWSVQVRAWMEGLHRRLVETPQCVSMLNTGAGLSASWLRAAAVLRRSLAAGGLAGPALSEGVFWVSMAATGFAKQTLAGPMAAQVDGTIAAIRRLTPDEAAELDAFAADVPYIYSHAQEIMIERTLASVEALRARSQGLAPD